jgi:septum formation protein
VRLVLASASPARLATLRAAGVDPVVVVSGVDESCVSGTPAEVARELAIRKAQAVTASCQPGDIVLGCDSVLDLDGEALGKPVDAADAVTRWQRMRGTSAELITGHCVLDADSGRQVADVARTIVRFGMPDDEEVRAYVGTGEPLRVAGAFTIDGLGGWFVDGIDGDPSNVIGLSLPLVRRMLRELSIAPTDFWR